MAFRGGAGVTAGLERVEPAPRARTLDAVRTAVRGLLEESDAYREAPAELQRDLAEKLVSVSMHAADLLDDDVRITRALGERRPAQAAERPGAAPALAEAQAAGEHLGMQATRASGRTIREIREALDFPTFVTNLITGVFQSISTSNLQQLESMSDLLAAVSLSAEDFAGQHITDQDATAWIAARSALFRLVDGDEGPELDLAPDADLAEHTDALRTLLDATEDEVLGVDDSELAATLLPLVRRKIGRERQQILATLVMMGLRKVVVDDGRLHASMDLRVDTRSAAEQMEASRRDFRMNTSASANFGIGAWGASASMSASVGYVQSDQVHTQEEIATRAGLRSSVDLVFHTEPVQLGQMATPETRRRIQSNARVPAAWEDNQSLLGTPRLTPPSLGTVPPLPTPPPLPTTTTTTTTRRPRSTTTRRAARSTTTSSTRAPARGATTTASTTRPRRPTTPRSTSPTTITTPPA